jgi:hypothetical protein
VTFGRFSRLRYVPDRIRPVAEIRSHPRNDQSGVDHTAKRVAQNAERIFAALEPDCRTIIVNAAHRFALPRKEKRQIPYKIRRFRRWKMGDSTPDPLHGF